MKRMPDIIEAVRLSVPVTQRDHIQGPLDARLQLVEYGDYECPACGMAYPSVKTVQEALGDRLCFVFRNFPLTNIHPHAEHAAEAAEAAAAQKDFWDMHDALYEHQDSLRDEDIAQLAQALSLDVDRLIREVEAGAYHRRIQEDFRGGVRSGVNGTPTFFINGLRHDGPFDPQSLLAALAEV